MTDDGDDGFSDFGDGYEGGLWCDVDGNDYAAHPSVVANYAQSAPFEPGVAASLPDPSVLPDPIWADPVSSPLCLDGAGPTASTNQGLPTRRTGPLDAPQPGSWSRPLRWFAF